MANTSIKFRDGQNWTQVDGLIIDQSALSAYYKDSRVRPDYVAPEISTHVWNGAKGDVQHIRHNGWVLEIYGRESELQKLSTMQSCDFIFIEDVDNGLNHTVDMQVSEWLTFGEPEFLAQTSNYRLVLEYRTNKTIINKFDSLSNQVTVIANNTYYSKYEKIVFDSALEPVQVPWTGLQTLEEKVKTGYKVLFYFSDSEKKAFEDDYKQQSITVDGTTVEEIAELEINQLGEDNYQVIATFITSVSYTDKTGSTNTVDLLTGSTHYYTPFAKLPYTGELERVSTMWDSTEVYLQESNDVGFKLLYYFTSSEYESFKNDWNQDVFTIDGAAIIKKLPLEATELESGNYQVVVSCVTAIDYVNLTTAMTTVSTMNVSPSTVYSSEFSKLKQPSEVVVIDYQSPNTSKPPVTLRETQNNGYVQLFYWTKSEIDSFMVSWLITAISSFSWEGSIAVLTRLPLEIEATSNGLYIVKISGYYSKSVSTHDLTPLNTHTLVVTDTSTYTFYTDYATQANVDDAEKSDFTNDSGLSIDSRIISTQVTDIKLFLNTADKNSLKLHYEKGTAATIDTVPILYRGIVSTNELGIDLWEVDIKGLTTAPTITFPL